MKKTLITAMAITAIAFAADATTTSNVVKNSDGSTTTTTVTTTKPVVHHKHPMHHYHQVATVASPVPAQYREVHVGDPTVVYHQIGTAGAQRNNTIVPMWHESIQSVKPYEIRYDYSI